MSSMPRLFVKTDLIEGQPVPLDEGQAKYLLRVMRLGEGDALRVFNGRDGEWLAHLSNVTGKRADLKPAEQMRVQPDVSVPNLTLYFAPVKKSETDLIIEKATELGVRTIQPVITEYTQTRTVRLDRFEKIALEAAEQTERLDLPSLSDAISLDTALEAVPNGTALIFCDEAGDDETRPWGGQAGRARPILEALQALKGRLAILLIGPEGGFSDSERTRLRERADTYPVSLGPRILRAETAAIAALSLWQAVCGDWT